MNRLGKYNTVIRLYDKYELGHESSRTEYADRVRLQFEFARDNLAKGGLSVENLGESSKVNAQNLTQIVYSKTIDPLKNFCS